MRSTLITIRARAMRKAMTEPEVMLWSRLRGRNPDKRGWRLRSMAPPIGTMRLWRKMRRGIGG